MADEKRTPREVAAQAIYAKMYDPRCDVEGAMWDEAEMWADVVLDALGLEPSGWSLAQVLHSTPHKTGAVCVVEGCSPLYRLSVPDQENRT
jgi:hypothetical protein